MHVGSESELPQVNIQDEITGCGFSSFHVVTSVQERFLMGTHDFVYGFCRSSITEFSSLSTIPDFTDSICDGFLVFLN